MERTQATHPDAEAAPAQRLQRVLALGGGLGGAAGLGGRGGPLRHHGVDDDVREGRREVTADEQRQEEVAVRVVAVAGEQCQARPRHRADERADDQVRFPSPPPQWPRV